MTYIAIQADYQKLRKVRRTLRKQGVEAYLPAIVQRRPRAKAGRIVYKRHVTPLMSYILAKAPEHQAARDLWLHSIRETKDVRGYVTIDGTPAYVSDNDVLAVWCQVSDMHREIELSKKKRKRWFVAGAKARLQDGMLAGRVGTVQWIRNNGVGLEMMLFGAKRVVTVQRDKLEAA